MNRKRSNGASPSAPLVLEVDRVALSYPQAAGRTQVLGGVSLSVGAGEFVSLLGPSGSGKTTLLGLVGGLERPDSGRILVAGEPAGSRPGLAAYMPQQAALLPWRTVQGNIELALRIAGRSREEARRLAREGLERLGLERHARSYPQVLSGGMQQRVSFLRALLSPQPLMLLDEPFGALDALTRQEMQEWLLSLWEQDRRSVLLVTHSIEEALLLSDRILVLSSAPATIVRELAVPFGRPRRRQLWSESAFGELKEELYQALRRERGGSGEGRA
ncbi:ABC transporter ATP-binding protein [Paenibacillus pasadenensis]|uniref:Hydroxymethylpyrimidine ABC transporter, ATPase component n=1 Tax=Paenibacillus pasadenensis TaxID=217090 RepID=A0A2N5N7E2_9BACL|nr:ABC transporter ATP-binding protein [Paenibacillus pasadenensis]PLT46271.1 Hydroxymethylpyrimidine ABC transporter, ATPase component [Paenibacillus pasadenensis]